MIVHTMTDEEIYNEIKNDFVNLNEKIKNCEGMFQKALEKAGAFPFVQSYEHITRERNNSSYVCNPNKME